MITISDDQLCALATKALEQGDLARCRNVLLRVTKGRHHDLLASVTYRLAKEKAASGEYQEARELFAEVAASHPDTFLRSLAQERNALINRIASGAPSAERLKNLLSGTHVSLAVRIDPNMLLPDIRFVGTPAAYRSGWDPQKGDPLSSLIRMMKKGVEEETIRRLGQYLAAYACHSTPVLRTADFVIPVPTRPERETARGYSIPRLLAEEISKLCAIPLHDELIRTSDRSLELRTVPQWYRKYAVQGAFQTGKRPEWLEARTVLVLDDVLTTGSTVREVARVMLANGAQEVSAIALAHTEWGG